jgi:hypothetical protein
VRRQGRGHLLRPLGHQRAQVGGDQLGHTHTDEREIILDEGVQADEIGPDLRHGRGDLGRALGHGVAQLLLQHVYLEKNGSKRIADFMGHPSGEAP